jgi:hypothetical protein
MKKFSSSGSGMDRTKSSNEGFVTLLNEEREEGCVPLTEIVELILYS